MPETSKQILRPINDQGDRLRIAFVREGKSVVRFTVQYEANIDGEPHPVVRYDAVHGFAHRDLLDWSGRTIIKTPMDTDLSYNAAMTLAIEDLATNWPVYRANFMERRP